MTLLLSIVEAIHFLALQQKRGVDILERVQIRATNMSRVLKYLSCEGKLKKQIIYRVPFQPQPLCIFVMLALTP